MNEKEKMLSGELYNPLKDGLALERENAKRQCFKYNNTPPNNTLKRIGIISKLLGKTGEKFWIEQPFQCDYGYNIEIGEN